LLVQKGQEVHQETQGHQAKMAAQGEPILKMICGKYVHLCSEIACLNLLLVLWDPQVLLEGEGLVDLENLALGVQLVTLESREKQDPEGFLGYLACLVTVDHPVSRVTGEYLGIPDLLEWEWRDLLGQPVLMDHLDPKGLENLDHKVLEDLLGNSGLKECLGQEVFQAAPGIVRQLVGISWPMCGTQTGKRRSIRES